MKTNGFVFSALACGVVALAACGKPSSSDEGSASGLFGVTQGPYVSESEARNIFSSVGFGGQANVAVAVAMCESSLGTKSYADSRGNRHTGLMQISDLHRDLCGFGGSSVEAFRSAMQNSWKNASCAYTLYKSRGNSFNDWDCYRFGSYKQFLSGSSSGGSSSGNSTSKSSSSSSASCTFILTSSSGKSQRYQVSKSELPAYVQQAKNLGWTTSQMSVSPASCRY